VEIVSVATLVEAVRSQAVDGSLERVEVALAVAEELTSEADELIGYFVEEARRDGRSWTQLGQRLGVSKQAARQRFAVVAPMRDFGGAEIRPRLRSCLEAAAQEAANDAASEIGTHHQLVGLFHEGVAAAVLEKLGLNREAVRVAGRELFPGGKPRGDRPPPNSLEAREALQRAAGLSRRAGLDYVGTEHLLAAVAFDPGSKGRRVLSRLGFDFAALKKELACSVEGERGRRRRRGKTDTLGCSFCGKRPGPALGTVGGPGVLICEECVRLCNEILAQASGG
jgi:ATP-dependent Clp protease ATP-binding subunit ClpA